MIVVQTVMKMVIMWALLFLLPVMPCSACYANERNSLLDFKQGLDLYSSHYTMQSWKGFNCCAWEGVMCHPSTGHVVTLDLSPHSLNASWNARDDIWPWPFMSWREIRGGLFQLQHLEHLDLSHNVFNSLAMPSQFHTLSRLRYLNLSSSDFIGQIPREIANMSSLTDLDLSLNGGLESSNLGEWITHLRGLEYLGLQRVNLSMSSGSWGKGIGSLANLKTLSMHECGLSGDIPSSLENLTFLEELDLSFNSFIGRIPTIRWPLSLSSLSLLHNNLEGFIPSSLSGLSKLSYLDLSSNQLNGSIPSVLGKLSKLTYFGLSGNSLNGTIPTYLSKLSKLRYLDLSRNFLSDTIPTSLGNMSKLAYLDLSYNSLNGTIQTFLAKLSKLTYLDLSCNQLIGTYSLSLLDEFPNIQKLDLSRNMLTVKFNETYIPKFQLQDLGLGSCNIEGDFPAFISTQYSLGSLDLSQNSLSGNIPDWLWDFIPLNYLNLSSNQFVGNLPSKFLGFERNLDEAQIIDLHNNTLQGNIPSPLQNVKIMDLSENLFDGPIPTEIGKPGQYLRILSLARNNLSGVIPQSVCKSIYLQFLDLSNNRLSGKIPSCLNQCFALSVLNLEKNYLKGMIPNIFGKMNFLETLKLSHNGLKGNIPSSLANCSSLEILDLSNNNIHGGISNWIESLQSLRILVLKSNKFVGKIPTQLSNLQNLQILDMSSNKFSGIIPSGFMNLSAMANQTESTEALEYGADFMNVIYIDQMVITNKAQEMSFVRNLRLVKCLDLSNNNLSGKIPWDIESLKGLIILNVSRNHFSGEIPKSLGSMIQLQSLDLSKNELSGIFPAELQYITSLSYFDVSHNKLSGMIPQGGQMMTFDASAFSNNLGLCGLQINVSCSARRPASTSASPSDDKENKEKLKEYIWWDVGISMGCAFGFSVVIWVLCFTKSWSEKCFRVMDGIIDSLFQTLREKLYYTR